MTDAKIKFYTNLSGKDGNKAPAGIIDAYIEGYIRGLNGSKHIGHWVEEYNEQEGQVEYRCICCNKIQLFETDFCCHCGLKMLPSC